MAYSEEVAQKLRQALAQVWTGSVVEKKMFGGMCILLRGNMACGILGDELIIRVGPDRHAQAMARPGTKVFDFSGKPMRGWVMVTPPGYQAPGDLEGWVRMGVEFCATLPAK